jgi:hypothetical protein
MELLDFSQTAKLCTQESIITQTPTEKAFEPLGFPRDPEAD